MNKRLLIIFAAVLLVGFAIIASKMLMSGDDIEPIEIDQCSNFFEYPELSPKVGDTVDLNSVVETLNWIFQHTEIKDISLTASGEREYVVFKEPGPYQVIVKSETCSDTFNIEVSKALLDEEFEKPDIRISGPSRGTEGVAMRFEAKGVEAKSYKWFFESGLGVQGDKKVAKHKFTRSGTYQIKLLIDGGKHQVTKKVVINPERTPDVSPSSPSKPRSKGLSVSEMGKVKMKNLRAIIANGASEDSGNNRKRYHALTQEFAKKLCGDCEYYVNSKKIGGKSGLLRKLKSDGKALGISITNVEVNYDKATDCITKMSITAPNYN